jgi:hypothetical protein
MMCRMWVLQLLRSMQVGMAQASTEHVRELAFPKSKISSSKLSWHVGLAVLKLKWPACMSRGRSARDRWRGALSRYIMSLPEPVGVTYICHGPDSRPRGPLRPSKRQGELRIGQPNPQAGPRVDV